MFDWIGDAVSWIGDEISNTWENLTSETTKKITAELWDMIFDWIFREIYGTIANIFTYINQSSASVFSLAWVQTFIKLFHNLSWMLFLCGTIVAVFDTAVSYESGQANIKNTCLNILKGFMSASLITLVPQRLYTFCVILQRTFSTELISSLVGSSGATIPETGTEIITTLASDVSLFNLFFMILFAYCILKVVFANIKRGGIMLCQIAVGSLYMFGVPRGFTEGFYSWCKQVIALCLTAFLQTTILFLGLLTFSQQPLLSLGICLSANEVPRIAQMFGLDTSVRVNMMSVNSAINMGSRAVKMLAKK